MFGVATVMYLAVVSSARLYAELERPDSRGNLEIRDGGSEKIKFGDVHGASFAPTTR